MGIRVLYLANSSGMVNSSQLDDLIASRKIVAFSRSDGWVKVGHEPVRGMGGKYDGPDRRDQPGDTKGAAPA